LALVATLVYTLLFWGFLKTEVPLIFDGSKHFKWLKKPAGKGETTEVMHIAGFDLECI
jgi:hypothetical protein